MTPRPCWHSASLCPCLGTCYHHLPKPCKRTLSWHHICNTQGGHQVLIWRQFGQPVWYYNIIRLGYIIKLYLWAPDVRRIIKRRCDFQELLKLVQHIHRIGLQLIAINYVQIIVVEIIQPPLYVHCIFSRVQAPEIEIKN